MTKTLLLAVATGAALALAAVAGATSPGTNGRIAFASSSGGRWQLETVAADGTGRAVLTAALGVNAQPAWSPDGTRVAFVCANFSICVINADATGLVRVTDTGAWNGTWTYDLDPTWSPDGTKIAFTSNREGALKIYVVGADGTNLQRLAGSGREDTEPAWSPDGARIAFTSTAGSVRAPEANPDVWVMNADGSGGTPIAATLAVERRASWAPSGARIAYEHLADDDEDEDAPVIRFQLWTMNTDGSGKKVATPGAALNFAPSWSPDGKRITYSSPRAGGWDLYSSGPRGARLTTSAVAELTPDWQSVPAVSPTAPIPSALAAPPAATGDARLVAAYLAAELDFLTAFAPLLAASAHDLEATFNLLLDVFRSLGRSATRAKASLVPQMPESAQGRRLKAAAVRGYGNYVSGIADFEASFVAERKGQSAKAKKLLARAEAKIEAADAQLLTAASLVSVTFV